MITLKQLTEVFRGEVTWMRIYPDGQQAEHQDFMGWQEIRKAVYAYGDRAVQRVYPGYGFIMVWLDR